MDQEGDDDCLSNTEQDESDSEFNYDVTKEHWDVNSEEILRDFNQDVCSDLDMPEFSTSVVTTFSTFLFLWATFYGISATALNHLIKFVFIAVFCFSKYCCFACCFSNFTSYAKKEA